MENSGTQTAIRDLGEITVGSPDQVQPDGSIPPKRPRRRRRYVIGSLAALVVIVAAAVLGNLEMSGTYSSERAVRDFLSAQSRGDVNAMWANGLYQGGEGAYHTFFTKDALTAMMKNPVNRQLSRVKVLGVRHLDSNTDAVTTSFYSNGSQQTTDFKVLKDAARTHLILYPSWRVVPSPGTIDFNYPNQAGTIAIDGIALPDSAGSSVSVIAGVHQVVMSGNPILKDVSQTVDVSLPSLSGSVTLADSLSPPALDAARKAVRDAFAACDASKDSYCPGHTYNAPNDGAQYFLDLPVGHVFYSRYTVALVGDPTADMTTSFESTDGHLSVTGTCDTTLSTDRGKVVPHSGTYDGKLVWDGTKFGSDVSWTC